MKEEIGTDIQNFNSTGTLNLTSYKEVKDISFLNKGTSDVTIETIDGAGKFILAVGDPMITFGGYDFCVRKDQFKITFAGTAGNNLIVFVTRKI